MADQGIPDVTNSLTAFIGSELFPLAQYSGGWVKGVATADNILNAFISLPDGTVLNGKIVPSVASNNLTLTLKTCAGNNPSATESVWVKINGTWRKVSAPLSVTVNAGANTFNAGSNELKTQEVDYFAYLAYRAASTAIVLGFSRIPSATLGSDFSGTSTNEKYCAWSTAPAAGDDCTVIGRFAATLSAAAGNWSVPTFTNKNLINRPIYETRDLTYAPTITGYSANPGSGVYQYRLRLDYCFYNLIEAANGTSNATTKTYTAPFTAAATKIGFIPLPLDNGANKALGFSQISTASNIINMYLSAAAAWTNTGTAAIQAASGDFRI